MKNDTHLSEEAVAACADGVLSGGAQDRANRHIASCPECAQAVRAQREAVWALRAAPPPPLPAGLFDRLREVPQTTPIRSLPTAIAPDGSAVLANYAPMAAFVPAPDEKRTGHRNRNVALAAATVALAGALTAGSVAHSGAQQGRGHTGRLAHAGSSNRGVGTRGVAPVRAFHQLGR
jgi:anti-sigma factor RsiW